MAPNAAPEAMQKRAPEEDLLIAGHRASRSREHRFRFLRQMH
jgi:hypothetical protein